MPKFLRVLWCRYKLATAKTDLQYFTEEVERCKHNVDIANHRVDVATWRLYQAQYPTVQVRYNTCRKIWRWLGQGE